MEYRKFEMSKVKEKIDQLKDELKREHKALHEFEVAYNKIKADNKRHVETHTKLLKINSKLEADNKHLRSQNKTLVERHSEDLGIISKLQQTLENIIKADDTACDCGAETGSYNSNEHLICYYCEAKELLNWNQE